MFSLSRVLSNTLKSNSSRRYLRIKRSNVDPGIHQRKQIFESNQELEEVELDDLEADFMKINKSHKEHLEQMELIHEKEKYHIVGQKYFKEKYPNFLTWNDKEQIRYLHAKNPEEWTVEKLSEGFPALPDVIMKILKSKWTKKPKQIENHDSMVTKNWQKFNKNEFEDLPQDLRLHLKTFTNRASNVRKNPVIDFSKVVEVKRKHFKSDFAQIITSYEKLKMKNQETNLISEKRQIFTDKKLLKPNDEKDTSYLPSESLKLSKKQLTLSQLENKILKKANQGRDLPEDEKNILQTIKNSEAAAENNLVKLNQVTDLEELTKNKYQSSTGSLVTKKTERDYAHLIYPEKIKIPQNKRKKGHTYKLNDCYYDYDGEFLYRVPGMG